LVATRVRFGGLPKNPSSALPVSGLILWSCYLRMSLPTNRQLWEGTVTEIMPEGFVAVLSDRTNTGNPDERATFDFDNTEISPEDLKLVALGSSFYWVIGIEHTIGGQVKNISMIQFRRVPAGQNASFAVPLTMPIELNSYFEKNSESLDAPCSRRIRNIYHRPW
jgi:hypothetical protein